MSFLSRLKRIGCGLRRDRVLCVCSCFRLAQDAEATNADFAARQLLAFNDSGRTDMSAFEQATPVNVTQPKGTINAAELERLTQTLLNAPDPQARLRAIAELEGIGGDAARAAITLALDDPDESVRREVIQFLENQ